MNKNATNGSVLVIGGGITGMQSALDLAESGFYVYLVECSDGTYYTGYTKDVEKRLEMHNSGKGAKYTRTRLPVQLIGFREFLTQRIAMQMEIRVKKMPRRDKVRFF